MKGLYVGLLIIFGVCALVVNESQAGALRLPSRVRVIGTQLIVEKRLTNGLFDQPKPYVIKGVTWSPATKAPAYGPNPFSPGKTMRYGFFYDQPGRYPPGQEALNYWLMNQPKSYFSRDILLMKEMNVNTVRLYTHLGDNPAVFNTILDYFYRNGIMVIMTVGVSRDDFEMYRWGTDKLYIYTEADMLTNHFIPSGWMGDYTDLDLKDDWTDNPYSGTECIKISYSAKKTRRLGWAGIYWQFPADNWGKLSGLDLRDYNKLVFQARGEKGGEKIIKFKVGGITGDTADVTYGPITLTNTWKEYTINLANKNLADISGGFCIVFQAGGGSRTVYLDDIYFAYDPALGPRRYLKIVELYKNHPAILMWSLGNEWNMPGNSSGYDTVSEAAVAINQVAQDIKQIDQNHPVTSCLGDKFDDPDYTNTIGYIVSAYPDVDVWGINVYRAFNFSNVFNQWQQVSAKPFFLSEFGTDSFKTTPGAFVVINGYQADGCIGIQDQEWQANYVLGLWDELGRNLSARDNTKPCLGGLVHEFNDELWKAGNFHIGLGGLNKSTHDYDEYNTEGVYLPGGHPDEVANEEYFGVVDANRKPKKTYSALRTYYGRMSAPSDLVATAVSTSQINLTWTDNSDNETGFKIERCSNFAGPFTQIAIVGADTTSYNNIRLTPGTSYFYRVRAYNNVGGSDYTPVAFATTQRKL